jgi:DNA-directed RNA polymerase subunit RPC12/RpoP
MNLPKGINRFGLISVGVGILATGSSAFLGETGLGRPWSLPIGIAGLILIVGSFGFMVVGMYRGLKRKCTYCGNEILYSGEFGHMPLGPFCTKCGKPLFEENPEIQQLASVDAATTSQNVAEKRKLWRRGKAISSLGLGLAVIGLPMPILFMHSDTLSALTEGWLIGLFLLCWIVGLGPLMVGTHCCDKAFRCPACGKRFSPFENLPKSKMRPIGDHCPHCGTDLNDYISKVFGI